MTEISSYRPRFTPDGACELARNFYALDATAHSLPSERDQNFHLCARDGQQYVLKIASAAEDAAILDFQNCALRHLANQDGLLPPARLLPTITGEIMPRIPGAGGTTHWMRLLTFLPGKPLAEVKPHSPALLRDLGLYLGTLDRHLAEFSHPAQQRVLHWDLQHARETVHGHIRYIRDAARRAMVEQMLAQFEIQAAPLLSHLRTCVIHSDANDYNVIVARQGADLSIAGVIDFGDMVHSYTVGELAVANAYVMLGKNDPLAAAAHVTRGYHAAYPLTEPEMAALYPLTCLRLCTSVALSAYQFSQEPENDYLRISEAPVWDLLARLAEIHPNLAHYMMRDACGVEPCPQTPHVVAWLARQEAAPIIGQDLRTAPCHVLDLSIGSAELSDWRKLSNVDALTHELFGQIIEAGADVGIGRYDEARPIYAGDLFATTNATPESDAVLERRTIHLGIDLFATAGTPIHAPLDGVVHSVANNSAPYDYGPTIILQHTTDDGQTFYTLYGHLSTDSLAGLTVGQRVLKGQPIATIGTYPRNGNWPPHLHVQIITDLLGRMGEFPGVAAPSVRRVWRSISPDPNMMLGIPAHRFPQTERAKEKLLQARHQRLGPSLSISYQKPLKIVRGLGQYLYDECGRPYLDAVNNVPHVGHCHPRVVKAGQRQMAVLNTNTRYLHDTIIEYAERLTATMPDPLSVCFFVCSGSEANELALRMARAYTHQWDILTVDGGYHGNTQALIEISPYKFDGPGGKGAPPYVHKVLMPDPYRGPYKGYGVQTGQQYAASVRDEIVRVRAQGRGIAAFIGESLLGCGGQIVLPAGYFATAYAHVRSAGGICIADEVQVGFGRVGSHFWGFQTQGVVPDIVTLGKPMGNGHPLAAVITRPEIANAFHNGMEYFNTFGGNPVSCAIGMAVLNVIEEEGLQQNAHDVGSYLMARLRTLMPSHRLIGDVRGAGLYIGVELVLDRATLQPAAEHASYIANRMKENGILISTDGPLHNVLKIKPPIVFTRENADQLVETLERILEEDYCRVG